MLPVSSSNIFQRCSQAKLHPTLLIIQVGNMLYTDSSLSGSQVKSTYTSSWFSATNSTTAIVCAHTIHSAHTELRPLCFKEHKITYPDLENWYSYSMKWALTETNYGKTLILCFHILHFPQSYKLYVQSWQNTHKNNVSQILCFPTFYAILCSPRQNIKSGFYFILTEKIACMS
jgi:hypothetical protein